ncbi:MAG: hypothetical protein CMC91_03645 [Flavobacteriaceae bacterium]|nr:hypothetical protein [Flavobacteriaceae bacterium]
MSCIVETMNPPKIATATTIAIISSRSLKYISKNRLLKIRNQFNDLSMMLINVLLIKFAKKWIYSLK